jgi:ribosomal protein L37AE/L43A
MEESNCKVNGCESLGKPPHSICIKHEDELEQLTEMHRNIPKWHKSMTGKPVKNFEIAGEILGENWDNYNRPKFTQIINNFDNFGDIGHNVLIGKIILTGQFSTSFDNLSGNWRFTGEWKENFHEKEGQWINSEELRRIDRTTEEEYAKWETCQLISASLGKSSDNFKESLLKILSEMTDRIEMLHTGEVQYASSLFKSFQLTAFLCANTFVKGDKYSDDIEKLGIRILKSKHPVNSKSQQLMGEPKILSKWYDEYYCAYKVQILLMCYGIVPDHQLASIIGINSSKLNHIIDNAEFYNSEIWRGKDKVAKKVIREHLGVSSKCIECNKFLLNPRHNYCRKHNPSIGRRSSSSSRRSSSSSSKFSSKTCKQCKKNKVDEFENNFQLCKKCFGMRGKGAYDPTFSDWYTGDDIK